MINRPRGTRDLGPDEMEVRNKVEEVLRTVSDDFNYREVLTPTFETTELFLEKSGPSIVEEIYAFEDKGGREVALRPEFTASVMRMYAENMREEPKPLKLFYFGPAFRYERPQSGRYREFWHFGTELIGPDTPRADAENISLAFRSFKRLGLEDFNMRISNLAILEKLFEEKEIPKDERRDIYHMIDKDQIDEADKKIDNTDLEEVLDADLSDLKSKLNNDEPVRYLKEVLDFLEYYGIKEKDYVVDIGTVRGLDYYKGVVFEIDAEGLGAEKQVCGGGDYSLGDIFDIDISSKGFAIGFDRLVLALEKEGKLPELDRPECYIIPIGEESLPYSYDVLQTLREEGITCDIELMERNIGKALGYADKKEFSYALLIGEDEIESDSVTIKDMDSGDQKEINKGDLLSEVKEDAF